MKQISTCSLKQKIVISEHNELADLSLDPASHLKVGNWWENMCVDKPRIF